jgi:hypothetical protein
MSKLLAPNGKPSNLTAEQYKLVRIPAFKKWFGDWENDTENASKVVDENGEPLIVWHGSNENITEFMPYSIDDYYENGEKKQEKIFRGNKTLNEFKKISKEKGWRFVEPNFWFSKNNAYSNTKTQHQCFLKIINLKEQIDNISSRINEKESKLDNFGIKVIWSNDNEQYYCVFNSNQIKLADGTNTTFDAKSDDIRYAKGGNVGKRILSALNKDKKYTSEQEWEKSYSKNRKSKVLKYTYNTKTHTENIIPKKRWEYTIGGL